MTPGAIGYPYMGVEFIAPNASDDSATYLNLYVGDTISLKRMTINAGIRFDRQAASVLPTAMAAPAGDNNLLPAVTAPGISNALVYNLLQPRLGITYSLTEDRKTQLRATYAMFTQQIGSGQPSFLSVAQYRAFYLDAKDLNGDDIVQPNEILWSSYAAHIANGDYFGFNPSNPSALATAINKVGSYGSPKTHEVIVGVDHELMPNVGVSASYTYRRMIDFNWRPIIQNSGNGVIDGSDYTLKGYATGSLPSGIPGSPTGTYSVPYYGLTSGIVFDPSKGTLYETHPDYYQTYKGLEVTATKWMAKHWMARVSFAANSWREFYSGLDGQQNPTPTVGTPNISGGVVSYLYTGSGKSNIYSTNPAYQLSANGAYQLPYDIDLGAAYTLRQGYPMPWYRTSSSFGSTSVTGFTDPLGSSKNMLIVYPTFDAAHLPAVSIFDFRVGKRQKLGKVTLNFDFDIFNVFNSAITLGRFYTYTSTSYTQIQEITQPRIMRFGLRLQF